MATETMSGMVEPLVSVVVLNWNGVDDTLSCLDSLATLTYHNFTVIVVDNGSTDDSLVQLRAYTAPYPLKLLETERNLGYAGGNNVGIRHALENRADFVMVLNNDTVVAPDLLLQLVHSAQRNPDAGVFSARILYLGEPELVWFDGARWKEYALQMEWPGQRKREAELGYNDHDTDYACGATLFFRPEVVRQIGLLDESFFLVWEEVDWCFRARKAGWRNVVVAAAKVWHKIGGSFGSEASPLRMYFSIRNELLLFNRHASSFARARLWAKNILRLIPKFHVSADSGVGFSKRLVWAILDYVLAWIGHGSRLEYLAARRAINDYFLGRYGDCPNEVRIWNQAWIAQHRASGVLQTATNS